MRDTGTLAVTLIALLLILGVARLADSTRHVQTVITTPCKEP